MLPGMKNALLLLSLFLAPVVARAGQTFTYVDLVHRLTDLEALAVLPVPGEQCRQWSSYDRASRYDEATGKYVHWSANGDGGGIIRREDGRSVFAEIEGPGVIWRIWSARPGQGRVAVYLDGADEPAVDLPFRQYFDGSAAPFQGRALCHETARGWNNYVPIPFQKSCKILAADNWGAYYHFTYTTYPNDTRLPTFRRELTPAETAALATADDVLASRLGGDPAGKRNGEHTDEKTVPVPPGQAVMMAALSGPRAITALRVRPELPAAPGERDPLRELCLRITWDDETTPAVWAPLGDFFGAAPGIAPYRSLPLGMTTNGFYALWYMPFAKRARVELVNDGGTERRVTFAVTHAPLSRSVDSLARFHAKWHRDAFLPEETERRAIDWTMLKTSGGPGRFVGVMLHVWNPRGGWWGEGDEKFFVDGERFPSTIGTGSEDYFGYAWCCPELFANAYHNQPYNDGSNKGHVCVNRWHVGDNVPFQQSFEAAIEKYYKNKKPTLYAATVYWYQAAGTGAGDRYAAVPVAERLGWYVEPVIPRVPGAIEGEKLKVVEKTGGNPHRQDMSGFEGTWSDDAHLWWTGGKPGDRCALRLPVAEDGNYKVIVQMTRARDYGIVQLSLDDAKLGSPFDLYDPRVVPTGELDMGAHALSKGDHRLTLEIVGGNEKAIKVYMVGLDYVKLVRIP